MVSLPGFTTILPAQSLKNAPLGIRQQNQFFGKIGFIEIAGDPDIFRFVSRPLLLSLEAISPPLIECSVTSQKKYRYVFESLGILSGKIKHEETCLIRPLYDSILAMVTVEGIDYFSLREAAEYKGVRYNTLSSAVYEERLPTRKETSLGGLRLIQRADLESWEPLQHGGRRIGSGRKPKKVIELDGNIGSSDQGGG